MLIHTGRTRSLVGIPAQGQESGSAQHVEQDPADIVRELKSSRPKSIAQGRREVAAYADYMSNLTGKPWTGVVDVYEP